MIYSILRVSAASRFLDQWKAELGEMSPSVTSVINRKGYLVVDLSKNYEPRNHVDELSARLKELSWLLTDLSGKADGATVDISISCPKNTGGGLRFDVYHFEPEVLALLVRNSVHLEISCYE